MKNEIVKFESSKIDEIVKTSGIDIQEGELIKQSYIPFIQQLSEIQEQASKINFENPVEIDEKIARELRLKTVKIRTGASDLKDSRKRIYLLKGNLEQSAFNLIKASCELTEETFVQVEKAREIAEKKRKEERKIIRLQKLSEFEYDCTYIDIFNMPDEQFDKLILQLENERDIKIAEEKKQAEIKAEQERIEKLHRERKDSILNDWNFLHQDYKNINFGELTADNWNDLLTQISDSKKLYEKEQLKIKQENERLRIENENKQKQIEQERKESEEKRKKEIEAEQKKQAEIKKQNDEKLRLQKIESDKLLKIEQEKQAKIKADNDKLQDEIKAKNEAEKKRIADEKVKKEAELKAKKLADKAPDKDKLTAWVNFFNLVEFELKTEEARVIQKLIIEKFNSFKVWAENNIKSL